MQLQTFQHKDLGSVRVVGDKENPLFCLSDICRVLELTTPAKVAESIKAEFELYELNSYSFNTGYGIKDFSMITEPQLYFVLMRSDKPKVKPFRKWICEEVLPAIRKNGFYGDTEKVYHDLCEALKEKSILAQKSEKEKDSLKDELLEAQRELLRFYRPVKNTTTDKNSRKKWSDTDLNRLRDMILAQKSYKDIALALGRTAKGVKMKAQKEALWKQQSEIL